MVVTRIHTNRVFLETDSVPSRSLPLHEHATTSCHAHVQTRLNLGVLGGLDSLGVELKVPTQILR